MTRLSSFVAFFSLSIAAVIFSMPVLAYVGYEAPLYFALERLPVYQPDVSAVLLVGSLLTALMFIASPSIAAVRSFWSRLAARNAEPVPIVG